MSTKTTIGKTKRSTDNMIDDAIAQQNSWLENRRSYARRFFKKLNVFARPKETKKTTTNLKPAVKNPAPKAKTNRGGVLHAYWFPIVCAFLVIIIAIWVLFIKTGTT